MTTTDLERAKKLEERAALSRGQSRSVYRWEKDFFLNVGNAKTRAESYQKWDEAQTSWTGGRAPGELVEAERREQLARMQRDRRGRRRLPERARRRRGGWDVHPGVGQRRARVRRRCIGSSRTSWRSPGPRSRREGAAPVVVRSRGPETMLVIASPWPSASAPLSYSWRAASSPARNAVRDAAAVAPGRFQITRPRDSARSTGLRRRSRPPARPKLLKVSGRTPRSCGGTSPSAPRGALASDGDPDGRPVVDRCPRQRLGRLQLAAQSLQGLIRRCRSRSATPRASSAPSAMPRPMSTGADSQFRGSSGATEMVEQMNLDIAASGLGAGSRSRR